MFKLLVPLLILVSLLSTSSINTSNNIIQDDTVLVRKTSMRKKLYTLSGRQSYAYFHAFPADGTGAQGVCNLPNWALQSEDFTTTWTLNASAGKLGTITASNVADPWGNLTADRLTLPAVTAPSEYSRILQSSIVIPGNETGHRTCSVYVKGNGTSGTIPIAIFANFPTSSMDCSYTSDSWTRCSVSHTSSTIATENFYIGASGAGTVTTPAQDIYIAAAMCNQGLTAAPYVKTTTVAAAAQSTSVDGKNIINARSGKATCDSNPLSVTKSNNELVEYPANMLRVVSLDSVPAMFIELTRDNNLWYSEDFSNGSWTKAGSSAPLAPSWTVNQAIGPYPRNTADRLQCAATSGSQFCDTYQTLTVSSGHGISCSFYTKGVSSGDSTDVCSYDGVSWACTTCTYNTSDWTRCSNVRATGTGSTRYCKIGNNSNQNGGISRNAVDLYVFGAQGEGGNPSYVTSYIPNYATGTSTRNVDTNPAVTFTLTPFASTGCSSARIRQLTPNGTDPGSGGIIQFNTAGRPLYNVSSSGFRIYDGTNELTAGATWNGTTKTVLSTWTGSTQTIANSTDSTSNSGSFDGTMNTTGPLWLGTSSDIGLTSSWLVTDIQLGITTTGCQN